MRPASDANVATSRRMAMRSMESACDRPHQVLVQTSAVSIKISSRRCQGVTNRYPTPESVRM
jgi:hypothetical protein